MGLPASLPHPAIAPNNCWLWTARCLIWASRPINWTRRIRGLLILTAVYLVVVYLIPKPAAVSAEGWRLTGIFIATIAGSILQSLPGGALVLMAVTLSIVLGGVKPAKALAG